MSWPFNSQASDSPQFSAKLKTILIAFSSLLTLAIIAFGVFVAEMNQTLTSKLQEKAFLVPTEYYTRPLTFRPLKSLSIDGTQEELLRQGYRRREWQQPLLSGDFALADRVTCMARTQISFNPDVTACLVYVPTETGQKRFTFENEAIWLTFRTDSILDALYRGYPLNSITEASLSPKLLTSYLGEEPFLQEEVELGVVPTMCLNSILAIEDNQFLEHFGVSPTGIVRALLKNITSGRRAQGGSTITQQLVKNYFLTSEKTISRKIQELILSVLLEGQFTKDEILATYINIIYMGRNGAYQIRGFGSASRHYFNKPIAELNLSECALMAAIVNSPGLFDPFGKPENAMKRRSLVLKKMLDASYINQGEIEVAEKEPLPTRRPIVATETAPYFIDAAKKELKRLGVPVAGHRVYLGLDIEAQSLAQDSLVKSIESLESNNKKIKALYDKGKRLEGVVLVADPVTGLIEAAVGGRGFRTTQFNRAYDGHRQVGSIFKPIVYLAALQESQALHQNGETAPAGALPPLNPLSILLDEKQTYTFDRQKWSPQNYGKQFFGAVPMYFALKESLNGATVKLGMQVGLDKVIQIARALGVTSDLKALPSLLLGAFELYPYEVLQSYATLSQLGKKTQLGFVKRVETLNGDLVFDHTPEAQLAVDESAAAVLVGMMKQTILSGTARGVSASGFFHPAAGKTGTTNDYRDAWFAGFTPHIVSVVWVGYDDNTVTGLTGGSGAVPAWTQLMQKLSAKYTPSDFAWPESTAKILLDSKTISELHGFKKNEEPTSVELIFKKGTEPSSVSF